jgi:lactonase
MSHRWVSKRSLVIAGAVLLAMGVGGGAVAVAGGPGGSNSPSYGPPPPGPRTITATKVAKTVALDAPNPVFGHITLLEGDSFGPDGQLYFVDLTAAPNSGKVFKLNLATKKTTQVYTDATSGFSSLQFSPLNGKIYLTDFSTGSIDTMNPDGSGFTKIVTGSVLGNTIVPDDIAFDAAGNLYVTDYQGTPFKPIGRILRFNSDGSHPTLVQGGLVSPNGISFSPDFSGLWIGELPIGHEDHIALAADGTAAAFSISMTANIGAGGGFDSNTVDADGNVYQCVPGSGKILVWNSTGDLIGTVVVPQSDFPLPGQTTVTNLAIKKGTRDAYVTVGGPNGGYIYHFTSFAVGIAQSNGGS